MATLTIDKAGRVVIPKPLRDKLHLKPGDELEIAEEGDSIALRPVRPSGGLVREHGFWVYSTGEPLTLEMTNQVLEDLRLEREQRILGPWPPHEDDE